MFTLFKNLPPIYFSMPTPALDLRVTGRTTGRMDRPASAKSALAANRTRSRGSDIFGSSAGDSQKKAPRPGREVLVTQNYRSHVMLVLNLFGLFV